MGQWSGGDARLFTIGVGGDVDQGFLAGLAEDHRGEAYFLSDEGDIGTALRDLFESFTFPVLLLEELSFGNVEIHDVHPRGVEALAAGRELFQVGRYREGGEFTLSVIGQVGEETVSLDFPVEFTRTDDSGDLIPRLWAHQKVQALEEQISRFGSQQELLDDILALGLDYRLVTRRTSLFAPDEGVEVNPQPRDDGEEDGVFATAVNDTRPKAYWLGHDFVLDDEVWVDVAYRPGMPKELYEGLRSQPVELADFALLGEAMLVVLEERAWEIRPEQPGRPVLQQNAPNPFNASTVIPFQVPASLAGEEIRLHIYNLSGQVVRVLHADAPGARGTPYHLGRPRSVWTGGGKRGVCVQPPDRGLGRAPAHDAAALRPPWIPGKTRRSARCRRLHASRHRAPAGICRFFQTADKAVLPRRAGLGSGALCQAGTRK